PDLKALSTSAHAQTPDHPTSASHQSHVAETDLPLIAGTAQPTHTSPQCGRTPKSKLNPASSALKPVHLAWHLEHRKPESKPAAPGKLPVPAALPSLPTDACEWH